MSRSKNGEIALAPRRSQTHTPRHMSLRRTDSKGKTLQALLAAACAGAVLFAFVLSAIPHLHEQIHATSSPSNHECAITLLASGKYQHTPNVAISVTPPAPPTSFGVTPADSCCVRAHLEFSLLEHAPPAVS